MQFDAEIGRYHHKHAMATPYDESKLWTEEEVLDWLRVHHDEVIRITAPRKVSIMLTVALEHKHEQVYQRQRKLVDIPPRYLYETVLLLDRIDLADELLAEGVVFPGNLCFDEYDGHREALDWIVSHMSDSDLAEREDVTGLLLLLGHRNTMIRVLALRPARGYTANIWERLEKVVLFRTGISDDQREWIPRGMYERICGRRTMLGRSLGAVLNERLTEYVMKAI